MPRTRRGLRLNQFLASSSVSEHRGGSSQKKGIEPNLEPSSYRADVLTLTSIPSSGQFLPISDAAVSDPIVLRLPATP
ncbi:hypothetical protein [Nostoc sp. NMS7]|uniref:hypothetical protein n=1 Tax=Nostoc sp. NMS7 TaxID=2815391 RepID=UPI0025FA9615|nr:hypothetical protein [Nostoc sp. NMS7]